MRSQMCFLGIIEGFEQGTFIDRRTGIAYVRGMKSHRTDFFNKIRTMFITRELARNIMCLSTCQGHEVPFKRKPLTGEQTHDESNQEDDGAERFAILHY